MASHVNSGMTTPGIIEPLEPLTVHRLPTARRAPPSMLPLRSSSSLRVIMGIAPDYGVPEKVKRARMASIKHLVALAAAEAGLDLKQPIQEQFTNGNAEAAIQNISRVLGWDHARSSYVALRTLTEDTAYKKRGHSSPVGAVDGGYRDTTNSSQFDNDDVSSAPKSARRADFSSRLPAEWQDITPSATITNTTLHAATAPKTTVPILERIPATSHLAGTAASDSSLQSRLLAPKPGSQLAATTNRSPRTLQQQIDDTKKALRAAKSDATYKQEESRKAQATVAALQDTVQKLEYTLGLFKRPSA